MKKLLTIIVLGLFCFNSSITKN